MPTAELFSVTQCFVTQGRHYIMAAANTAADVVDSEVITIWCEFCTYFTNYEIIYSYIFI